MSNRTVVGTSSAHERTGALIGELGKRGISTSKISVLLLDVVRSEAVTVDGDTGRLYDTTAQDKQVAPTQPAPPMDSRALAAGLAAISIPAVGLFLAAGPMLTTLRTVGAAAAAGDIAGGLVGYGVPEYAATAYERALQNGATLIAAHCDSEAQMHSAAQAFRELQLTDVLSCIQLPFGPRTTATVPGVAPVSLR
jgi:hypothetical protein